MELKKEGKSYVMFLLYRRPTVNFMNIVIYEALCFDMAQGRKKG